MNSRKTIWRISRSPESWFIPTESCSEANLNGIRRRLFLPRSVGRIGVAIRQDMVKVLITASINFFSYQRTSIYAFIHAFCCPEDVWSLERKMTRSQPRLGGSLFKKFRMHDFRVHSERLILPLIIFTTFSIGAGKGQNWMDVPFFHLFIQTSFYARKTVGRKIFYDSGRR